MKRERDGYQVKEGSVRVYSQPHGRGKKKISGRRKDVQT
jgi:hypothetical protein